MEFVIEGLSKSFEEKQVLKDIDFRFEEGKIYGLLGRNGAGKTTLFNCLNKDIDCDGGRFYFDIDGKEKKVCTEDVGYVLSTPTVPEFLTGREFLKFFIEINESSIANVQKLDDYFDMVKIDKDDSNKLMRDYSHGMKNKMQMLVNVMVSPNLLLLDEPLTSLDVVAAEEIKDILKRQKEGKITILSTHILDLALDMCDSIILLNHGCLQEIDRNELGDEGFKQKIIEALRDE